MCQEKSEACVKNSFLSLLFPGLRCLRLQIGQLWTPLGRGLVHHKCMTDRQMFSGPTCKEIDVVVHLSMHNLYIVCLPYPELCLQTRYCGTEPTA
jgi:hypothetical protein